MYVTPEDITRISDLGGIQCTMSGANTFYSSGALTLTTPQLQGAFFFLQILFLGVSNNPKGKLNKMNWKSAILYLGCVRMTIFRNRNTWNIPVSWKSFVFTEIHIKIAKHLLKCYFKHIFAILATSKRAKHTVLIITPRILIPE